MGERLHKVSGYIGSNSGFHGNRKPPLTYNGENDVSTFYRLFFIRSFLYLQVTWTCMQSQTSSNFARSDHCLRNKLPLSVQKFPIDIMGKCSLHASSFSFDRIIIKVADNQDRHKRSEEFDSGPDPTTHFGVTCP